MRSGGLSSALAAAPMNVAVNSTAATLPVRQRDARQQRSERRFTDGYSADREIGPLQQPLLRWRVFADPAQRLTVGPVLVGARPDGCRVAVAVFEAAHQHQAARLVRRHRTRSGACTAARAEGPLVRVRSHA